MADTGQVRAAGPARGGSRGRASTSPVESWSSDRPATVSKRSLVAVSHAIERALLAGPVTEPTVVVALFQHLAYFEREYAVYDRIAQAGAVVVLAFADGETHHVPPGCQLVVLDPSEPLADEWSVIAVGPEAGAYLVATDAHRFDPTEHSLEAGREFTGRWGYSRVQAANELARMRAALGGRLDTAVGYTIDRLLAQVMPVGGAAATSRGTDGEQWATHSLHRMVERMQDAREGSRILRAQLADAHAAVAARASAHVDAQSGLTTPEFLTRWTNTGGPTALPVGVALIDVPGLDGAEYRLGRRIAYHAARRVAAAVTEPLGPVDAAVRLSEREFALVVPGASSKHLRGLVAAVTDQLELSSDGYPNVPLTATVAWTVTLARPLPLDDLHLALGAPDQPASTLGNDPIVVVGGRPAAGPDGHHHLADPLGDDPLGDPAGELGGDPDTDTARDLPADPETDRMPRIRVSNDPTTEPDDTAAEDLAPAPDTAAPSASERRPSPSRRRLAGGEPALSMLPGLPRRSRGEDGGDAALFRPGGSADVPGAANGTAVDPPPNAS